MAIQKNWQPYRCSCGVVFIKPFGKVIILDGCLGCRYWTRCPNFQKPLKAGTCPECELICNPPRHAGNAESGGCHTVGKRIVSRDSFFPSGISRQPRPPRTSGDEGGTSANRGRILGMSVTLESVRRISSKGRRGGRAGR